MLQEPLSEKSRDSIEPSEIEKSSRAIKSKFDGKEVVATKMGPGNDVLYVGYQPG